MRGLVEILLPRRLGQQQIVRRPYGYDVLFTPFAGEEEGRSDGPYMPVPSTTTSFPVSDSIWRTTALFLETPPVKRIGARASRSMESVSTMFLASPWQSPSQICSRLYPSCWA